MNSRNRNFIWVPLIFLALGSGLNAQKSANSGSNVPALPADIPGSARRYSVLIMGNLSGQQAIWTTPDGKLHEFFQFNDRGRGPSRNVTRKRMSTKSCANCARRFSWRNWRVGFELKRRGRETSGSMPSAVGLISNIIRCWWIYPMNR